MAEFSKYPDHIDTTTELPKATDLVTPVKAEVVNRLRDAIVAIESELGIQPSSTYSTVRARLDALEAGGIGGGGNVSIEQDNTIIEPQATTINFTGAVSVSAGAPHEAIVNIGGSTQQTQESLSVSNGQTAFTLSSSPVQENAVEMFVNGLKQQYGTDYTVADTIVTYAGLSLISTDKVEFWYITQIGLIGGGGGGGGDVEVQDDGATIDAAATTLNFSTGIDVTSLGAGSVEIALTDIAKVRVFRATSDQAGAAVGVAQTVSWNGASTLVTSTSASTTATQISPDVDGHFVVNGQLTLAPLIDAVGGITIEVLQNATTVHTVYDSGAVWGVGINRSIPFSFTIDLDAGDTLSVRWTHSGGVGSTQELIFGEGKSWFGFSQLR